MVLIITLGEYSGDLIVDQNMTKYDELSCEERKELIDNIDEINITGVSIYMTFKSLLSKDFLSFSWKNLNQMVLEKTSSFMSFCSCVLLFTTWGCFFML